MTGVTEEVGKVAGGVVDAMRSQPLAIANIVLNVCFLLFLFYYVSRIATRAETVVGSLFAANDKLYGQWGTIIKDMGDLAEKSLHCVTIEDALRLLQAPRLNSLPAPGPLPPLRLLRETLPTTPAP